MTPNCKGLPLSVFFDYDQEDVVYADALVAARDICDACPIRAKCLMACMEAEGNDSPDYRAGIFAGFTPQQRHSLHKRGTPYGCGKCGTPYDPVYLRSGILRCSCKKPGTMTRIPDRGDLWTERHTKLARMTIGWFIQNLDDMAQVPDALSLSRTMKVGVKDLRRVYQALKEDHVLRRDKDTGKLLFQGGVDGVDRWLPKHLRKAIHKP